MIDITMTASRRPEIIEQTLSSFKKNLFAEVDAALILNIDPVGPGNPVDVLELAGIYFPIKALRTPREPSFPRAFQWAWSMADADYVFHLEDDWLLTRPVDLRTLMAILKAEKIASVRLPAFAAGLDSMKNWNKVFRWAGQCYEPPADEEWLGFCGHPSLIRGSFVQKCAFLIDPALNPEKQFHSGNPSLNEEFGKWKYVVYGEPSDPPAPPLVVDIGRQWMEKSGWKKAGAKAWFTEWEKA
jgi:hypothetical protein